MSAAVAMPKTSDNENAEASDVRRWDSDMMFSSEQRL
jgi:hypothetical protein